MNLNWKMAFLVEELGWFGWSFLSSPRTTNCKQSPWWSTCQLLSFLCSWLPTGSAVSTFVQLLCPKSDFRRHFSACFSMTQKTDKIQAEVLCRARDALQSPLKSLGRFLLGPEINKIFHFWVAAQKWSFTHISAATCGVEILST